MAQDEKRDPEAGISRRSVLKVAAAGALAGVAATLRSAQRDVVEWLQKVGMVG